MRKLTHALVAAGLLSMPALVLAEDAPAKPKIPIPALDDVLDAWGLSLNGYLDVSYSHLTSNGFFVGGFANRVFDARRDSFSVHQAAFTLAKQPKEGFGALVNLIAGEDADIIHALGTAGTTNFDVTQAFVQYAKGPYTLIGGKYVTLAGAEVINPTQDTNFSRSILFGYAIPFTHTGVRGTYAVNDKVSLILGVNNGWDQLRDANSAKTIEAGFSYAPLKNLTVTTQGYFGKEQVFPAPGGGVGTPGGAAGNRGLVDALVTYNATDKLTLILNPDLAMQQNASTADVTGNNTARWWGIAAYAVYQFTDQWRGTLRAEYFDDKDGYRTGVVQKWKEVTYTMAYLPTKNIELRGEVRYDRSNGNPPSGPFEDPGFAATRGTGKGQSSVALEALFKF
ncbi:MAG TPA: outer membrane beta-barrel protein [Burkholderiales bacterium]|nr:outer membrane beta-barrel protein [Burkholderiales bacterium]